MLIQIHLAALALTALVIIYSDIQGLLWVLGRKKVLEKKITERLHRIVWLGLLTMIVTGFSMAWTYGTYLMSQPAFLAKMFFVLVLVGNAFLIGVHMKTAFNRSFNELDFKSKRTLLISGAISTISWISAFIMAKIMF